MKRIWPLALGCLLWRCSGEKAAETVTLEIVPQDYAISMTAEGTLKAVKATQIKVPHNVRGSLTIAWLAAEGTRVEEGDELIRFDETAILDKEIKEQAELGILGHDSDIVRRSSGELGNDLEGQIYVTDQEKMKAEDFAPRNENLYSREEIIESEVSIHFLGEKIVFLNGNLERHGKKAEAESQIQDLKVGRVKMSLDSLREQKKSLVILAPHAGFFYHKPNWRGERPKVGQNVYRGMVLGELPDLNEMEAAVFVLENDAGGLKPELEAEVTLDAEPGKRYKAKVKTVAGIANPRERESPVKYFEVSLSLEQTNVAVMKPSSFVKARIFLDRQENVITVPNQVLFSENGAHWVYVKEGSGFKKQLVTIGKRGPNRSVIDTGLKAGDKIALSEPAEVEDGD